MTIFEVAGLVKDFKESKIPIRAIIWCFYARSTGVILRWLHHWSSLFGGWPTLSFFCVDESPQWIIPLQYVNAE
jgi:hypothetical protein